MLLVARRKRYDDPTPQTHASEETWCIAKSSGIKHFNPTYCNASLKSNPLFLSKILSCLDSH